MTGLHAGLASINRPYPEALEFAGITSQFSSLTHIKISFHETLGSCLPHNNLILGEAMLTNYMISNPQHHSSQMTSLALSGILAFPGFLIRSDSAADALASLTHLDIHFNYIDDERMISKFRSLANARRLASIDIYFPSSIKPRVNPPPWKLTHLTLTAAAELVYFQPIDFGALQLPNLTVLVVENMTLRTSPTDSLEDFIVRHTTVRKLVLRDCMLVHTRRYWSEVYDRISSALARLVDLSVGFGPPHREWVNGARVGPSWFGLDEVTPIKEGFTLGYCYMGSLDARDDFKFVRDFVFDPAAVVRDGAALKRLQAKVEERAQARTGF